MPRIEDHILDCTVYLYKDEVSARKGEDIGGSGFLVGRPVPAAGENKFTTWAVTNKHVIDRGGTTVRVNTLEGSFDVIDTLEPEWFFHPETDLAIRPINLKEGFHKIHFLTPNWFMSEPNIKAYAIGPGDECFVVGRFVGHDGKQRNTPTVRFGVLAQMPFEKVQCEGDRYESFLVEIRSLGGYSGSPVFVYLDAAYYRPIEQINKDDQGKTVAPGRFDTGPWLLGIDWAMVPTWYPVRDKSGRPIREEWAVEGNSGMTAVIPAWHLRWLLMEHPPVVELSKQIEERLLENPAAKPHEQVGNSPDTNLSR